MENTAPSFSARNGNGKLTLPVGLSNDYGQSLSLQADGKLVLFGYSGQEFTSQFLFARLTQDGTLDPLFGTAGKLILPVGSWGQFAHRSVVQADGKIVAVGTFDSGHGIFRLNADGTPDNTFATAGRQYFNLGVGEDGANGVALQADGKIVITGYAYNVNRNLDFTVARLCTDGSLDSSFGDGGTAMVPVGTANDYGQTVVIQADGKILCAGATHSSDGWDVSLVRLNADGTRDTSFGTNGTAVVPASQRDDFAFELIMQADGKILIGGYAQGAAEHDFLILRLTSNGTLDPTFNGDGIALIDVGGNEDYGRSLALQTDGKIVMAGYSRVGSNFDYSAIRVDSNGDLDSSFGNVGKVIVPVGGGDDYAMQVLIQADGKINLGGRSHNGKDWDFSVVKLNENGSLDTTFGSRQISTMNSSVNYGTGDAAVALNANVKIYDAELALLSGGAGNYAGASLELSRHGGSNSADIFSGNEHLNLNGGIATVDGVAIGTTNNANGRLRIDFNSAATQDRVDVALSSLSYSNLTAQASQVYQIDWVFSDGNSGSQGTGGTQTTTTVTTINLLSIRGPEISENAPGSDVIIAPAADIVINFSEPIQRGTGSVVLKTSTGSILATYDAATSANLTFSSQTLTINPSADLSYASSYTVELASSAIRDADGHAMNSAASYGFETKHSIAPLFRSASNYFNFNEFSFDRSNDFPGDFARISATPNAVATFDANGDGNMDVLVVYSHMPLQDLAGVPIRLLLGDGLGAFTDGTTQVFGSIAPISDAAGVVLSDFNGDGRTDVFIFAGGYDAYPFPGLQDRLLLSSDAHGMVDATTTNLPASEDFTHWASAGDIDGDGDIDIFVDSLNPVFAETGIPSTPVSLTNDESAHFLLNDGRGVFTRSDSLLPFTIEHGSEQYPSSNFIDVDGDRDLDLFLGYGISLTSYGTSVILTNDGHGRFSFSDNSALPVPRTPETAGISVLGSLAADINQDEKVDLLITGTNGSGAPFVQVLINEGAGKFNDATSSRMPTSSVFSRTLAFQDANGDGVKDLILDAPSSGARVFLNNGDGYFFPLFSDYQNVTTGLYPADFNNDNHLDYLVAGFVNTFDDPSTAVEFYRTELWKSPSSSLFIGDSGSNSLLGSVTSESFSGFGGDDIIFAGAGDDTLTGGAGNDTLDGGAGSDTAEFSGPRSSYTILSALNDNGVAIASSIDGNDVLAHVEFLKFTDQTIAISSLDVITPKVAGFSPTNGATGVAISDDIVLNFNEAVQRGVGNVVLKTVAGTLVATYDAATSNNLNLSGNTLTINPGANLAFGTVYMLEFAVGSIKDLAGNSYVGTSSYSFTTIAAPNNPPTGNVIISGIEAQGQTLIVNTTQLLDADGLGILNFQWLRSGNVVPGANSGSYLLTQADVGSTLGVRVSYTDARGQVETVTSLSSAAVINVNDAPTGSVTITGTPTQGETLTATNSLADIDGLGTITYQWNAADIAIAGATTSSVVLTDALVNKVITVTASYTDGHGTLEAMSSAATAVVANVNDAPTGSVTITGTPTQGETLTASNSLADIDGLGTITYQWKAADIAIAGATTSSLVLTEALVNKVITVTASYTDDHGTLEAISSAATAVVANFNDAPTGGITITGTPTQGETLTASNSLADVDGLGTITYHWKAADIAIAGATTSSLVLTEALVNKVITVTASYTDGHGTLEEMTSAATAVVANVNDAPTGSVTIAGTPTQGATLTASNSLADIDGLGTITYQWKAADIAIAGATTSSLVLTEALVNKVITVTASYTDGHGTLEAMTSAATAVVANVNDAPTGRVTITGTPTQGETLTASNSLADIDGLGTITYQWKAADIAIAGATTSSLVLTEALVNKVITVTASYTDGHGTLEAMSSAATAVVANVNDAPTGSVTITGTPIQGETLTASHSLADIDGLGTITYQWNADGLAILGATKSTLVLSETQVGKAITVTASYIDGHGTLESITNSATQPILGYQVGTSNDDQLLGTPYTDTLFGMAGNDSLTGDAGNDIIDGGAGVDTAILQGSLSNYTLKKTDNGYLVRAKAGSDGTDSITNIEEVKFIDKTINLTIQAQAAEAPQIAVQNLIELYVAFFNRVPDSDGLAYWIGEMKAGQSIDQIADSFYNAGIHFSSVTGFDANMSNSDFVNVIYRNVLGRADGGDADGVAYWSGELASGNATRASLVSTMLNSAHSFKNDATWGWVANLLDNKIMVAKTIAIDWGVNFNTPEASITNGIAIAAMVTPTDTNAALSLIGISATDLDLT